MEGDISILPKGTFLLCRHSYLFGAQCQVAQAIRLRRLRHAPGRDGPPSNSYPGTPGAVPDKLSFRRAMQSDAAEQESARVHLSIAVAAQDRGKIVDGNKAAQRIGNVGVDARAAVQDRAPEGAVEKQV